MRIYLAFPRTGNIAIRDSNIWIMHVYPTLVSMGHDVVLSELDFDPLVAGVVQPSMLAEQRQLVSNQLVQHVRQCHRVRPIDLFFSYLYSSCVMLEAIEEIRAMGLLTVNFSCNNVHQFHTVKDLAPLFDYCMVPERAALEKFRQVGARPIHIQMGANPDLFEPLGLSKIYSVTFIGAKYADRADFISALVKAGIPVRVWGAGWRKETIGESVMGVQRAWKLGGVRRLARGIKNRIGNWHKNSIVNRIASPPVSDEEMVRIYNQSKIALNFSKALSEDDPGTYVRHMRLRDFEIPMTGVFYMPEYSDELEEYYEIDREAVTFNSPEELVDKARYYLAHDREREQIARAGYRRAISEHTWEQRFRKLFREIGLA